MNRVADFRAGARVECRDGVLGTVQRIERDDDGTPLHLRVREDRSSRVIIVPLGLVNEVDDGGTVWLRTTRDESQRFTPGAGRGSATERIEPQRAPERERTIPLHREDLVARVEPRELGSVVVRTEVEDVPGSVEVEGEREEIEVEHIAVNEPVRTKVPPWYENGELVVPVYEERVVVSKQLVLKEKLRLRRVSVLERQTYRDTLRRERVVVEDPERTEALHEKHADHLYDRLRSRIGRWFSGRGTASDEKRSA